VDKVFNARTERVPTVDLSCEDYGLVCAWRRATQGPVLRLDAQAQFPGDLPASNVAPRCAGGGFPTST
jgi:carboxypeptidase Q